MEAIHQLRLSLPGCVKLKLKLITAMSFLQQPVQELSLSVSVNLKKLNSVNSQILSQWILEVVMVLFVDYATLFVDL